MNRNTNWKSKVKIKVLFKKALLFNVNFKVKKSMIFISLQAPSQPTQTSWGQLLMATNEDIQIFNP
jgi:hypothetical protein